MPASDSSHSGSSPDDDLHHVEACQSYVDMQAWCVADLTMRDQRTQLGGAADLPESMWELAFARLLAKGVLVPCPRHAGRYLPGDYSRLVDGE